MVCFSFFYLDYLYFISEESIQRSNSKLGENLEKSRKVVYWLTDSSYFPKLSNVFKLNTHAFNSMISVKYAELYFFLRFFSLTWMLCIAFIVRWILFYMLYIYMCVCKKKRFKKKRKWMQMKNLNDSIKYISILYIQIIMRRDFYQLHFFFAFVACAF